MCMKISLVKQLIPLVSLRSLVLETNDRWHYTDNTSESSFSLTSYRSALSVNICNRRTYKGCPFRSDFHIRWAVSQKALWQITFYNSILFCSSQNEKPLWHICWAESWWPFVQHLASLGSNSNGLVGSFQLWDLAVWPSEVFANGHQSSLQRKRRRFWRAWVDCLLNRFPNISSGYVLCWASPFYAKSCTETHFSPFESNLVYSQKTTYHTLKWIRDAQHSQ